MAVPRAELGNPRGRPGRPRRWAAVRIPRYVKNRPCTAMTSTNGPGRGHFPARNGPSNGSA